MISWHPLSDYVSEMGDVIVCEPSGNMTIDCMKDGQWQLPLDVDWAYFSPLPKRDDAQWFALTRKSRPHAGQTCLYIIADDIRCGTWNAAYSSFEGTFGLIPAPTKWMPIHVVTDASFL